MIRSLLNLRSVWRARGNDAEPNTSWFCADASSRQAPDRDELMRHAERCRHILKRSIIDFYLPACVDRDNGGYLENLRDGRFAPTGEKFLTMQGRQLWFFSRLVLEGIETDAAIAAARAGFDFLEDRIRDRQHGGYFAKVSDAGRPVDPRKHVYLNAFALYALVGFYRATGDERALVAAKDLFRVLDQKAHDREHGGYAEFFSEQWDPIIDPGSDFYIGPPGMKTFNTHLHILEAWVALHEVWPDPVLRERIAELVVINTITLRHPRHACNLSVCYPDWRIGPSHDNATASYGHDLECVWLVVEALRMLGFSPLLLRGWAEAVCMHGLQFGYDTQHGGFFYGGAPGMPASDTRKEWWVQAEALVTMLELYRQTKRSGYYAAFCGTLDFIENHQVAPEGGWWATCAADGAPMSHQRSSMWQGAYHSGRAMIQCARALEALASTP